MILLDWWRAWRKPYLCPECPLRCKSKQGMGRHIGAHVRKLKREAEGVIDKAKALTIYDMQGGCGVSDCKLPMPHTHYQEAK